MSAISASSEPKAFYNFHRNAGTSTGPLRMRTLMVMPHALKGKEHFLVFFTNEAVQVVTVGSNPFA